jgi:hypothetical protein
MITVTADTLTYVDLIWIEKRVQRWIRFGSVASEQIIDRHRSIVAFAPGDVFAFVRWASNDFGTVVSRIDILRAVRPGGYTAGRRSSACCRRSMPSRRWPSIQPTSRRTTGGTSTTG